MFDNLEGTLSTWLLFGICGLLVSQEAKGCVERLSNPVQSGAC